MNTTEAVLNFIYFTANHPGMYKVIEGAFGENTHLSNHLKSKLDGIIGEASYCAPQHVLKFFFELDDDNKELVIEWVEKNYNHRGKN
jgi:hypothetical protein